MKYYVLASLIIFCLVVLRAVKKSDKQQKNELKDFWARETEANQVRKKSIENLDYVHIPNQILSVLADKTTDPLPDYYQILRSLCESKMVNLSHFTNTDLKLEYGAANLTLLSEYDQNYSLFIRTLHQSAELFAAAGDTADARLFWEYAISIQSDITGTYTGLANLYTAEACPEKLQSLITAAKLLDSPNKTVILRRLEEFDQSVD